MTPEQTRPESMTQTIYEVATVMITGIGLSLDPGVFLACMVFASVGSYIGKGYSSELATRRGFWLSLGTGLFFALTMLLLSESMGASYEWWPNLQPQLVAIVSGFLSPVAVPLILKRFPSIADRLVGKVLPPQKGEKDD